eukprot:4656475-Amphidinium_carterae.1
MHYPSHQLHNLQQLFAASTVQTRCCTTPSLFLTPTTEPLGAIHEPEDLTKLTFPFRNFEAFGHILQFTAPILGLDHIRQGMEDHRYSSEWLDKTIVECDSGDASWWARGVAAPSQRNASR